GWPRDTVDGAVAVLVNSSAVNATRDGNEVRGKDLVKQQANAILLATEGIEITAKERMLARKPFLAMNGTQPTDEHVRAEARNLLARMIDLAKRAGGEPPLPLVQVPSYLMEMADQTGNQLIKSLAEHAVQLESDIKAW